MQQLPITSSLIQSLAYDEEHGELHVVFKSNQAHWIYGDAGQPVPQEEAEAVQSGGGSYFLANVRGAYPERRG
jgi:hypothetical protein